MCQHSFKALTLALALVPALGHASHSLQNVTATCSESLTIVRGDDLSFQCTGDLSVSGDGDAVRLLADRSITLSAVGRLSIDRLNIISPEIQLNAGSALNIGRSVVLFTPEGDLNRPPSLQLTSGTVTIRPDLTPRAGLVITQQPRDLTVNWSSFNVGSNSGVHLQQGGTAGLVPEPGSWLLALGGIAAMVFTRLAQRHQRG